MGITGDSIILKSDYIFDRVENLKVGDSLLNPEGKECIVEEIETYYSTNGYDIKTNNFFNICLDKNTNLLCAKIQTLLNSETKTMKTYLYKENYINIKEITPLNYFAFKFIPTDKTMNFEDLYLYSKIILKGKVSLYENKNQIILNNSYISYKNLIDNCKNKVFIDKKDFHKFYILSDNFLDLNNQIYKRTIYSDIFYLEDNDLKIFLENFLKENTQMYMNNNQFRINIPSKIMVTQLFYLFNRLLDDLVYIELIKKNSWSYKKIKQSNKRNEFSITRHPELQKIIKCNNYFWQKQEYIKENNRNLKYFNIKTSNNESFFLYNLIIKPQV